MFSRRISARYNRGRVAPLSTAFNGNFASFWGAQVGAANVLQVFQSDLGLTYGGTPLAAGTAPVVVTQTGTITGKYVPVLAKVNTAGVIGAGATFDIYYDGGTTPTMVGIAPAAGTPFPLTGAAAGLSWAWAAGSSLADNTWTATNAGLADQQTGNTIHNYTQATAAQQPIITVGLNGRCGFATDGVDDLLLSTLDLPAPGTTPWSFFGVYRILVAPGANGYIITDLGGGGAIFVSAGTRDSKQYNGAAFNVSNGSAAGAWGRVELSFTNSTSDYIKFGATPATGTFTGNADPGATRRIGGQGGAALVSCEFLNGAYLLGLPSSGALAAFSAAVTQYYGASVVV